MGLPRCPSLFSNGQSLLPPVSDAQGAWPEPLPRASALVWLWKPAEREMGPRPEARTKGWLSMAPSLAQCLGHMKYNMADASQTLLMLPKAENTQCPGLGARLALLGQEWGKQLWCLLTLLLWSLLGSCHFSQAWGGRGGGITGPCGLPLFLRGEFFEQKPEV